MKGLLGIGGTGVMGVGLLVLLLFATPVTLYRMVPLAKRDVAQDYVDAAEDWRDETEYRSTDGRAGVLVDWQEVITLDAVRLDQDFQGVTYSRAMDTTRLFTQRHRLEHEHCDDEEPPNCGDVTHIWYTRKSLEQVMTEQHFSAEQKVWAYQLLERAWLLTEPSISCEYEAAQRQWQCTPSGP